MAYGVKLKSRAEREAKIAAGIAAATRTYDFYDFRNQKMALPVVRVDIDLPIYRMRNFRTFVDQRAFLRKASKPDDFFQSGQENESVQQIQHDLLVTQAKKERGSVVAVIDVLEKEKQREPLLMTHSGVMVNGNRRLAAMRELYGNDPKTNAEFSHVDCMVLPADATPEEIVDIEASLQGKPETRLDYDWIGDAELISELIAMGRSPEKVAQQLNRKEKEIRNAIQALAEADIYLSEWAKAPGEYDRVREDAEQFFKDLPNLLENKPNAMQDASRAIAWTLFDNKEKLGGRLYAFNVAFGKRAADVLDRVAGELDIEIAVPDPGANDSDTSFAVDVDEDAAEGGGLGQVVATLRDPALRVKTAEIVLDAARDILELERGERTGSAALRAATAANSKLAEIDLSKAAPQTYDAIGKQLEAVVKKAGDLKTRLQGYKSGKAKQSTTTE